MPRPIALIGLGLGTLVDRRFLLLPAAVAGFLLQHALQGWCPPLPLFRSLGVRTAGEIDEERSSADDSEGHPVGRRTSNRPAERHS